MKTTVTLLGFGKKTSATFKINEGILKGVDWVNTFKKLSFSTDKKYISFGSLPLVKIKGFKFDSSSTQEGLRILFTFDDNAHFLTSVEIGIARQAEFIVKALSCQMNSIFKKIDSKDVFEGMFFVAKSSSKVVLIPYFEKDKVVLLDDWLDKHILVEDSPSKYLVQKVKK